MRAGTHSTVSQHFDPSIMFIRLTVSRTQSRISCVHCGNIYQCIAHRTGLISEWTARIASFRRARIVLVHWAHQ